MNKKIKKVKKILKYNGYKILQVFEKDFLFDTHLVTFEATDITAIRAYQLLSKEGIKVLDTTKELTIVDGVIEEPYYKITFL